MSTIEQALHNSLSLALDVQNDLVNSTPELDHALSNTSTRGLPSIAVSPAQGAQLSILCQMVSAKRILEIGTLGGYSTIWFANSVPGVKVTTIEYNAKHRDVAMENLKHAGVRNAEILLGKALDILPTLQGPFDFVFIDADWDHQKEYFDWAVKLSRKGGCIYVDNAVRAITEPELYGEYDPKALVDFAKKDERVTATLIPTLATHKKEAEHMIDGYLLAVKK